MSESHSIVSAPLKHVPGARTKWQCCSLCCTKHSLVCPCCYWVCQHHPWAHLILGSGIVTTLPGLACSRARAKGVSNSLVSGLIALLAFDHLSCWRYNWDDGLPQLPYNSPASLFSVVIVQWYVPSPCKHCMWYFGSKALQVASSWCCSHITDRSPAYGNQVFSCSQLLVGAGVLLAVLWGLGVPGSGGAAHRAAPMPSAELGWPHNF